MDAVYNSYKRTHLPVYGHKWAKDIWKTQKMIKSKVSIIIITTTNLLKPDPMSKYVLT